GDDGGTWTAHIEDGSVRVEEGPAEEPTMSLTCSAEDFVKIANGELNGGNAFMMGKLKIDGEMSLAMKLQTLLS
ncbi:MAG: SCP2 sterol-binding domain-containing protein, partial [Anaerolineae bacterium]